MTESLVATTPAPTRGQVIDLDAQRKVRAAAREGKREPMPIMFGGEIVATLPVELPIDVFTPLRALDADISMVLRQIISMYRANQAGQRDQAANDAELVVDLLAANPELPVSVLNAIQQIARNLLSDEGYVALMEKRPTIDDLAYLAKMALAQYGVTLGESRTPSDSPSTAGVTSNETSSPSLAGGSTPDASGATPTTPTSSESGAS